MIMTQTLTRQTGLSAKTLTRWANRGIIAMLSSAPPIRRKLSDAGSPRRDTELLELAGGIRRHGLVRCSFKSCTESHLGAISRGSYPAK